jgi:hypothetical protein
MDFRASIEKFEKAEDMKQEFDQMLDQRVERSLKIKPHGIVPQTAFARVSMESLRLFRDGYFYGSIALSQSVGEAIVRFVSHKNGLKPAKFEKNVKRLQTKKIITTKIKEKLLQLWDERNDYHHLNDAIAKDRTKLEALAYEKALLLKEIESEIFKFSIVDGNIIPENIKYWDIQKSGHIPVFLKLD